LQRPIVTSRLHLRALEAEDAAAIVRYLNNYEVTKTTGRVPFPYGPDDAVEFLERAASQQANGTAFMFAVAERGSPGDLIGVVSLERDADNGNSAELGYWLGEPFWGRGLMGEAAKAVLGFGFAGAGLARLHACYHLGNEASRRILMGLGFKPMRRCAAYSVAQARNVDMEELELLKPCA
jgi:[ribosomal protein S5]-alanine N-acetyltransferase